MPLFFRQAAKCVLLVTVRCMEITIYYTEVRAMQRYIVFGKCSHEFVKIHRHGSRILLGLPVTGFKDKKAKILFLV